MKKIAEVGLGVLLLAHAVGCSSSNDGTPGDTHHDATGSGGSSATDAGGQGTGGTPDVTDTDAGSTPSKNGADGCPVNSGFVGDDRCLAAPAAGEGLQLHFGPKDYDDPDEVALFTLEPGKEIDKCFFSKMPNDTDLDYTHLHGAMRPGSHHFIARSMEDKDGLEGFQSCAGADAPGTADGIGGSQFGEIQFPADAPENAGLISILYAGRTAMLNGHFINSTEEPTLAEAWMNYTTPEKVDSPVRAMGMSLTGGVGMRIEPHTQTTLHYSCTPEQNLRIVNLSGHFHAHTTRYSAWKVDKDGVKTLLMESFNWEELGTFDFDSVTKNPEPDRVAHKDGAFSGTVTIGKDEALEWECEIDNTSDGILKFRNEVFTGEMCMSVGVVAALPGEGETKPFGCTRN